MMTTQYNFDGSVTTAQAPSIVADVVPSNPVSLADASKTDKTITRTVGILVDQHLDELIAGLSISLEESDIDVELNSKDFFEVYNHMCDIVEEAVIDALNTTPVDSVDEDEDEEDLLYELDEEDLLYW